MWILVALKPGLAFVAAIIPPKPLPWIVESKEHSAMAEIKEDLVKNETENQTWWPFMPFLPSLVY